MTLITNLHRTGLDFEVARGADGARRFERIEPRESRDLAVDPKDPLLGGYRHAGLIRIGPVAPKRQALPPPPKKLLTKATSRRRTRKGKTNV